MYHYESLGDERFQEFCQALISASFPNAQCLPVGQPDGGRDAYFVQHVLTERRRRKQTVKELIVFQVKFVRSDTSSRDSRDFIESIAKKERAKIERLKSMGLNKYYILTNVSGTSHPGSGSIDKTNKELEKIFGIEAFCWWRDDLDRRLDAQASIKWSYPEILKATDLLHTLVHGQLGEDEERRRSAVRAYMVAQYDDDQELKFKQTDLRSTMTDLFVDLPMRASFDGIDNNVLLPRFVHQQQARYYNPHLAIDIEDGSLSSAEYFLRPEGGEDANRIVLEGAPGQGKSTVTQFLCQVLRMRLLDKADELTQLPKQYHTFTVRIPFRVDLRDLAKWIDGIDPFQSKQVTLNDKETLSLEGFLAGQVRFVSGGHDFSVSDLTAVARSSHILLALDGFDEVADINLREKLVAEITKGSSRLINAGGFSVITIVTSRPAAFAKSIRFPRQQWTYFELLPLERSQVDGYTTKWMKARGLKEAEKQSLRRTLEAKLKEPHTQFLAKNPMQLTILLSLIHNRGASLPEKRTAMYDAYMDMFFSRESDKSDIVRENRDLLIDIHRFLAWKLQTAAESGENGSIEQSVLKSTLFSYLDSQGENTNIVNELFNGIIERVGALVSRVQDTYEFEVQPLREYFVARHLYETAPYSPVGDEKNGTKLDRFDALVRNPYWLNVARFYGGCFSKGEISALVDELVELSKQAPYDLTSHPRSVASMLLGDWVFTQYQPAVRKVVGFIGEYPPLRQLLANAERYGSTGWSALPARSGRAEFFDLVWAFFLGSKHSDEKRALAKAIIQNSTYQERYDRWRSVSSEMPHGQWVRLGALLSVYEELEKDKLENFGKFPSQELIVALIDANRFDHLNSLDLAPAARHAVLWYIRSAGFPLRSQPAVAGVIGAIKTVISYFQYNVALSDDYAAPVGNIASRKLGLDATSLQDPIDRILEDGNLSPSDRGAFEAYARFLNVPTSLTSTTTEPWIELVEALRAAWGDCPAIDRIAFLGAGVRSKTASSSWSSLTETDNLVAAARHIRMKSGAPAWWNAVLLQEEDTLQLRRKLLLLWLWGTVKTISKIAPVIAEVLDRLSEHEWLGLCRDYAAVSKARPQSDEQGSVKKSEISHLKTMSSRACMFVGQKLGSAAKFELAVAIAKSPSDEECPEVQFSMDIIIEHCRRGGKTKTAMPYIIKLYNRGGTANYVAGREDLKISGDLAREISSSLDRYPLPLVAMADAQITSAAGAGASKLLDVADREGWFR